jgi:hypothetical protein
MSLSDHKFEYWVHLNVRYCVFVFHSEIAFCVFAMVYAFLYYVLALHFKIHFHIAFSHAIFMMHFYISYNETDVLWIRPRNCIHNPSFSYYLPTGPSKLDCLVKQGWEGLLVTNTLVYWANLSDMKKLKCCEYTPGTVFTNLHFLLIFCLGPIS